MCTCDPVKVLIPVKEAPVCPEKGVAISLHGITGPVLMWKMVDSNNYQELSTKMVIPAL